MIKISDKKISSLLVSILKHVDYTAHLTYRRYFKSYGDGFMYFTNGRFAIRIKLDIPAGLYSLIKQGREVYLVDNPEIYCDYPDLTQVLKCGDSIDFTFDNTSKDLSLSYRYCKLIHALSAPDIPYCFDIEYFKLIPESKVRIYTDRYHTNRNPFLIEDNLILMVIMPIIL